jgi:hypothetical protein
MTGKFNLRRPVLLALVAFFMIVGMAVAMADNLISDGDGVSPITDQDMALGTFCADQDKTATALIAINRNGAAGSTNVFKDSSTVTVSVFSTTGTGITAAMGVGTTIAVPSNWGAQANNTKTGSLTATVTVNTSVLGPFVGSVIFRGAGVNSSNAAINRDDTMNVTGTVEDCSSTDTTPPDISYVLNPSTPDGANGWYVSDVTLTWTVSEPESPGSLVKTGCIDQSITADQLATDYSCSATSDGGSAGPVTVSIKRDATAPLVSLIGGPADGGSYYFGFVPAAPTCDASDATSGLDGSCSVSGYSSAVGTHTVTASATDFAGNEGSASATYTVLAWELYGFFQPVDMNGVLNTVRGGSTVPLKFRVFAGDTELTDTAIVTGFDVWSLSCDFTGATDAIEFTTTGGTSLRYDFDGMQFVQNWKTPKSKGCYQVTVRFADGGSLQANFMTK